MDFSLYPNLLKLDMRETCTKLTLFGMLCTALWSALYPVCPITDSSGPCLYVCKLRTGEEEKFNNLEC
jgi:hypothetical protein